MIGLIDVKQKGGASVGYWVYYMYVTLTSDLTRDLDLGFFKVKFQNNCISGIVIWLLWIEKKANQLDTGLTVWSCPLTIPLILSIKFQGQRLKSPYCRNERADWHATKGMWVNRYEHDLWVTMVGWVDVPDSDRGDFRRRRAVDISNFGAVFTLSCNRRRRVLSFHAPACRPVCPLVHPGRRYRSNSFRISATVQIFGGMMRSTLKQIAN